MKNPTKKHRKNYSRVSILILWLTLFTFRQNASAQASLGFSSYHLFTQDTVDYNDFFAFSATLKNYSSSITFNNFVDVSYAVNGITQPGTLDNFYAHLTPGDSMSDPMHIDHISNLAFTDGDNVVVIWPVSLGSTIQDSLPIHVFVNSPSGIKPVLNSTSIKLNYNNGKIYFFYPKNNTEFFTVSVSNVAGKVFYTDENLAPTNIDVAYLPAGIYFVKAISSSGKVTVLKFISSN